MIVYSNDEKNGFKKYMRGIHSTVEDDPSFAEESEFKFRVTKLAE